MPTVRIASFISFCLLFELSLSKCVSGTVSVLVSSVSPSIIVDMDSSFGLEQPCGDMSSIAGKRPLDTSRHLEDTGRVRIVFVDGFCTDSIPSTFPAHGVHATHVLYSRPLLLPLSRRTSSTSVSGRSVKYQQRNYRSSTTIMPSRTFQFCHRRACARSPTAIIVKPG
jgi:hypothetical protein